MRQNRKNEWCALVARVRELEDALVEIELLIRQLPSGIDKDAHPEDDSPADSIAHVGGLVWQIVDAKLKQQQPRAADVSVDNQQLARTAGEGADSPVCEHGGGR